jgi:Helix-turn-helix domain
MEAEMIDIATCSDYTLLSTTEVAEVLNISEASVRKQAREGRLKAIGGFRVLYFSARAVRQFVDGRDAAARRQPEPVGDEIKDAGHFPEAEMDLG